MQFQIEERVQSLPAAGRNLFQAVFLFKREQGNFFFAEQGRFFSNLCESVCIRGY